MVGFLEKKHVVGSFCLDQARCLVCGAGAREACVGARGRSLWSFNRPPLRKHQYMGLRLGTRADALAESCYPVACHSLVGCKSAWVAGVNSCCALDPPGGLDQVLAPFRGVWPTALAGDAVAAANRP